ncbi:hypothetical protein BJ170DRAFT_607740 [Xylariales sp. AK1849]|nr:hypothetical protein BJ170DRAFT_607740 [Xylariales sp. AK1849]
MLLIFTSATVHISTSLSNLILHCSFTRLQSQQSTLRFAPKPTLPVLLARSSLHNMSSHGSSNTGSKTTGGMASSTTTPANAGLGDNPPKAFDAKGAIGNTFTEQGALGGAAQKIGGPFDKDGIVGKQFTTGGSIGGSVQSALGGDKGKSN